MPGLYSCFYYSLFSLTFLKAQFPEITIRFTNPQYDCVSGEYCLDIEFQSDSPGEELFGINVRFFYDNTVLDFLDFRNFEGGYGPFAPNPPNESPSGPAGPALFNFDGGATFVNGAIQLVNTSATPIIIPDDGSWVKIFQMCFDVIDPNANLDDFCPSIVWDLQENSANGGYLVGDDGVVMTVVTPDPNVNSAPADVQVIQYNWAYSGDGATSPFGVPTQDVCISIRCIDMELEKSVDNAVANGGDQVVFTIDVNNVGPDPVTDAEVTDLLPSGYTYVSDDGNGAYIPGSGVWTLGALSAGESTSLNITVTINFSGDYVNLAEVTQATGNDLDSTPGDGVDTDGDTIVDDDPDDNDDGDGVTLNLACSQQDVLLALYNATNGPSWSNSKYQLEQRHGSL